MLRCANDALPFAGVDSLDKSASSSDASQKDNGNQRNANMNENANSKMIGLSLFQPLRGLPGKRQQCLLAPMHVVCSSFNNHNPTYILHIIFE